MTGMEARIVEEFRMEWLAPDGLAKLEKTEMHPGFTGEETAENHNSVLWIVFVYYLADDTSTPAENHWASVTESLVSEGIYHRRPGDTTLHQSVDNLVALFAGDAHFGTDYGRSVLKKMRWGWYDNLHRFPCLRYWIQPHVHYFAKVVYGEIPNPFEFLWFIGTTALTYHLDVREHWNVHALHYLMLEGLLKRPRTGIVWRVLHRFHSWIYSKFLERWKRAGGFDQIFYGFEPKDHPLYRLSLLRRI